MASAGRKRRLDLQPAGRSSLPLCGRFAWYGVESIRVGSAEEFKPAMEQAVAANKAGRPFLVEAPMENIVVPTPGCWNINDIYSPNDLVRDGKLVQKENGVYITPNHAKSHKAK